MHRYLWETPEEINLLVAKNERNIRKRLKISQKKLSDLSGVSYASIKRFEATGNISLISLTKIAVALDAENGIKNLFKGIPYKSIQEVINEQKNWGNISPNNNDYAYSSNFSASSSQRS